MPWPWPYGTFSDSAKQINVQIETPVWKMMSYLEINVFCIFLQDPLAIRERNHCPYCMQDILAISERNHSLQYTYTFGVLECPPTIYPWFSRTSSVATSNELKKKNQIKSNQQPLSACLNSPLQPETSSIAPATRYQTPQWFPSWALHHNSQISIKLRICQRVAGSSFFLLRTIHLSIHPSLRPT